ncbi:hypothetical protein ACQJBY_072710 [Aegilops geniculata]
MEYYDFADESEPAWIGMKRGHGRSDGKLDAAVTEKRRKCDDSSWKAVAAYAPVAGTKRACERPEEFDLSTDKRYKCNYWEDPTNALILELRGGRKSSGAARSNMIWRTIKEIDDWCDQLQAACESKM